MVTDRLTRHTGTRLPILMAAALLLSALGAMTVPAAAQGDNTYVAIAMRACSPEFDVYGATPDELKDTCVLAEDAPAITFTITHVDGVEETVETKGGMIMLADVPTGGMMTQTGMLPEGMGEPVVYCSARAIGSKGMEPTMMTVMNGNSIEVEPLAGATLSCLWFTVEAGAATPSASPVASPAASPIAN